MKIYDLVQFKWGLNGVCNKFIWGDIDTFDEKLLNILQVRKIRCTFADAINSYNRKSLTN